MDDSFRLTEKFISDGVQYTVDLSGICLSWEIDAAPNGSKKQPPTSDNLFKEKEDGIGTSSITLVKVDDNNLNKSFKSSYENGVKLTLPTELPSHGSVDIAELIHVHKEIPKVQSDHNAGFAINFVVRRPKHVWRLSRICFFSNNVQVVAKWTEAINKLIRQPKLNRPKSLIVFINPVGGKKNAPAIYRKMVAPYFDMAGIKVKVIMTERANHARDIILEENLSGFDGLISVGGDGMFTEILHGLMARTHRNHQGTDYPPAGKSLLKPDVMMGIIPAGSTDTVIWSLQGCSDATTAALHIIIGDILPMDVATLHQGETFIKYNVSLLAYGFYGDVLIDSELNRWMGPRRYDWAGVKKFLKNKAYEGMFSYIPNSLDDSHPKDGVVCKVGCQVCSNSDETSYNLQEKADVSNKDVCYQDDEWRTLSGRFIAINAFLISCRCRFSRDGPSPCAHSGDGCLDVVVIHSCSRSNYFKHLYRCTQPGKDQFELPHVEVYRVKAFKFQPVMAAELDDVTPSHMSSKQNLKSTTSGVKHSSWNCDGEIVTEAALDVMAHKQVIKMFARGVEDIENIPITALATKSSSCFQPKKES